MEPMDTQQQSRSDSSAEYSNPPPRRGRGPVRSDLPYKSPGAAGLLSALMPGLGQVYVGYIQAGVTVFLAFVGCVTVLSIDPGRVAPLFGITLAFVYFYGIVDAVQRAGTFNRYLEGTGPDGPPPDMAGWGWKGSRTGGVILVLLGCLLAAKTMFDIEMEWLGDVWPLGLIGVGIWLFVKGRRRSE